MKNKKEFYQITSRIECQEFDMNNDPLFSLDQMVFAMEKYHLTKVAESESKNLKQAHVIKSVCENIHHFSDLQHHKKCEDCGATR